MSAADRKEADGPPPVNLVAVGNFVKGLGLVLNNISLYSLHHKITISSLETCFEALRTALEGTEHFTLGSSEEHILINDAPQDYRNPLVTAFGHRLSEMGAPGILLMRGMPAEEFVRLVEILAMDPGQVQGMGGVSEVVGSANLKYVKARKVRLQEVADDEVVIEKEVLADQLGVESEEAEQLAQVLSYFKGDAAIDLEQAANLLEKLASDPARLAQAIADAAADHGPGGPGAAAGESLGELMAQGLQKTFDALMQSPLAKTKKGRKQLKKTILDLRDQLVAKLQAADPNDTAGVQVIDQAVDAMIDHLQIDALASDYAKRSNAIEKLEERILRFMKALGADKLEDSELKERLTDGGLSDAGWRALCEKSGVAAETAAGGAAGGGAGGGGESLGRLTALLTRLESLIEGGVELEAEGEAAASPEETVKQTVEQISGQVEELVQETETKIDELTRDIQRSLAEEEQAAVSEEEKRLAMSRKLLFATLAEIVQELRQPLSVILSTCEMIAKGMLGDVSVQQVEMLGLAVESAERLAKLIDKLAQISGMPMDEHPDTQIIKSLYE